MPWIDKITKMSVRTQNRQYDKVATYSRDQQPAEIRISVNFHIPGDQVENLYSKYGSIEGIQTRLLDPRLYEHLKNTFGQFNAVTAIQERSRLNLEVQQAMQNALVNEPVFIDSVQIENIDFSDAYEQSVEARMLAEVEVAKLRQNAEREKVQAQITVIQAQAKADAVVAAAKAEANRIEAIGNAQAQAIKARGDALKENPNLVELTAAERWNGALPTTMVPGGTVPFLPIKNNTGENITPAPAQ
jgi:regulator of protease activity HflC (stomatin/prohibitin superfamily)